MKVAVKLAGSRVFRQMPQLYQLAGLSQDDDAVAAGYARPSASFCDRALFDVVSEALLLPFQ